MNLEIYTQEALAHYIRGSVTLFFIFWSILLNRYKKRSRMMKLLYLTSLLIAICYAKDILFIVYEIKYSEYINSIVGIIDMVYIPMIAAFFLEVVRPGAVTSRQLIAAIAFQSAFIPIYIIWPSENVVLMASCTAFIISAITVVCVTLFVIRYRKLMFETFSNIEDVDVRWVLFSCYAYFGTHILYSLSFKSTTWLSETIFNITGMILWSVVFMLAQKHRVLKMFLTLKDDNEEVAGDYMPETDFIVNDDVDINNKATDIMEEEDLGSSTDLVRQERDRLLRARLQQCMEQEKLYLMPKLSIVDLAAEIGTNKTYISDYLNNTLNLSFHDYVNKFRVEEACSIIDSLPFDSKRTMIDISTSSGFNSISSFNRHFVKYKGISPRQYLFEHDEKLSQKLKSSTFDD